MDAVCVILAMALGGCVTVLGQKIIAGMENAPTVRRNSKDYLRSVIEVAENTIADDPLDVRKGYLRALVNWDLFSKKIYDSVKTTEKELKKHTCRNCGHKVPNKWHGKCSNTGLVIIDPNETCEAWKKEAHGKDNVFDQTI